MTATAADVVADRVRQSGLVPAPVVAAAGAGPDLLGRLVGAGHLTPYQAGRIAAGKYKGFAVGGYVILDRLGGGGMGQVYLAEHAAMGRRVALKVLPAPAADAPVLRGRFLREARATAALDHPNVLRVHDFAAQGRLLYLVAEYVHGVNLADLVGRDGPRPPAAAADYARQAAAGLAHAHARGFVHRDVKPSNLLLSAAGAVTVLDFGLVWWAAAATEGLTPARGGTILGTADYLAPEQAVDSSAVDARSDVYALGATLYYLLAGRPLFVGGGVAQKLMWQQWRTPDRLDAVNPVVPAGLAAAVHRAVEKSPAGRFPTAAAFAAAVAPFARGPAPPPAGVLPPLLPPRGTPPGLAGRETLSESRLLAALETHDGTGG